MLWVFCKKTGHFVSDQPSLFTLVWLSLFQMFRVTPPFARPFCTRPEVPYCTRSGPFAPRPALLHESRPYCTSVGPFAPGSLLHQVPFCTKFYEISSSETDFVCREWRKVTQNKKFCRKIFIWQNFANFQRSLIWTHHCSQSKTMFLSKFFICHFRDFESNKGIFSYLEFPYLQYTLYFSFGLRVYSSISPTF